MSKKCVNLDGIVYNSNNAVEGKGTLYSTQGEQVYQSSLKVNVSLQICGALNCKDLIFEPEKDLEEAMIRVPQYEIGASTEEEEIPKSGTVNLLSICVPVTNKLDARVAARVIGEQNDKLRKRFDDNADECLLKHPKTRQTLTTSLIRDLKQKVSSYNQEIKKSVIGKLQEAGLVQGTAEWIQHYGANMGRNRKQIAAYSVRVIVSVNHNIYNEFSIANLEDRPETYDYKVSRRKRYSIDRRYVVDVPVQSLDQLNALKEQIDAWTENYYIDVQNDLCRDVVRLGELDERSAEQIANDEALAASFNQPVMSEEVVEIVEEDSAKENQSLLDELFANAQTRQTSSAPFARRGQVQINHNDKKS